MRDEASIQILEAVLVAMLLLAAAVFVLTFSLPSSPTDPTRARLVHQGENALATFYDLPLDAPRYGNNTLSKALVEALEGNPANLTGRFDAALPPGVRYQVLLSNGYGTTTVYSQGTPPGESVAVHHLLEPRWSYTWLATDANFYDSSSAQGLAALPVLDSNPVTPGGTPVDAVVTGTRLDPTLGNSGFSLATTVPVAQASSDVAARLPAASVTYVNATGVPTGYRDLAASWGLFNGSQTRDYTVLVNVTGGVPVAKGTHLTIHLPRGWTAAASSDANWTVLANDTDATVAGDLVAELRTPLDGALTFTYQATYLNDTPDLYVHRARLDAPVLGQGILVVRERNDTVGNAEETPQLLVAAPASTGSTQPTTWVVVLTNPRSTTGATGASAGLGATLRVDGLTLDAVDGAPIFGSVVKLPGGDCPGNWTRVNATNLAWRPTSTCTIAPNGVLTLPLTVTGAGADVPGIARGPLLPAVRYDGGYRQALQARFTGGFLRGTVLPPDTTRGYPGWSTATGSHSVTTGPHVGTTTLAGSTTYAARPINAFRDTLALGRVSTTPRTVPVGGDVRVQTDVRSLLLALSNAGVPATVTTSIYPPWALDDRYPVARYVHDETIAPSNPVTFVGVQDLNGDGRPDVLAVTNESKLVGLDGATGVKLAGFEVPVTAPNSSTTLKVTAFRQAEVRPGEAGFVLGTSNGDILLVNRTLATVASYAPAGSSAVVDLHVVHDWTGDGNLDVSVAWSNDTAGVVDLVHHRLLWIRSGVGLSPAIAEGTLGPDHVHGLAASLGSKAGVSGEWNAVNTSMSLTSQNGTPAEQTAGAKTVAGKAVNQVVVYEATSAVDGYDAAGDLVWSFDGGQLQHLATADLDGSGATEVVGSTTAGSIFAVNGTEASDPFAVQNVILPTGITKMQVLDDRHAYYITNRGNLWWTDDGFNSQHYYYDGVAGGLTGNHYTSQFPGVEALDFRNVTDGWMAGTLGHVWRTRDAGASWTNVSYTLDQPGGTPVLTKLPLTWRDVRWPGGQDQHGVLAGGACVAGTDTCTDGVIAVTSDGGSSWREVAAPGLAGRPIQSMKVAPDGTLVAVGAAGGVWTSPAGGYGTAWTRHPVDLPGGSTYAGDLTNLWFFNATRGFVVGPGGTLLATDDGGSSWTRVPLPTNATLRDIAFRGPLKGDIVGDNGTVLQTPDGGRHWVLLMDPSDPTQRAWNWRTVGLVHPGIGWFGGGDGSGQDQADIGFLTGYLRSATARTSPGALNALLPAGVTDVASARVLATEGNYTGDWITYGLSDRGCGGGWIQGLRSGDAAAFTATDNPQLCLRMNLTSSFSDGVNKLLSPWVLGLALQVNLSTDGGATWSNVTLPLNLHDASLLDPAATTATWNRTDGSVRLPYVGRFWGQQVPGAVTAIVPYDGDGDGRPDVAVGTADRSALVPGGTVVHDRHVRLYQGTSGVLLATSPTLPGDVVSLQAADLHVLTGDATPDLVATTRDGNGTWRLVALDGSNLGILWTQMVNVPVEDVWVGTLRNASAADVVVGTSGSGFQNGQVLDYRGDGGGALPRLLWSSVPVLKGRYAETYHVPRGGLFGPYVVETEISWQDQTLNLTQHARLYTDFVATPPDGILPPSPVYGVDVVLWYEDWR